MHSQSNQRESCKANETKCCQTKPPGSPKEWFDGEREGQFCAVPEPVTVGGYYTENVRAGIQIRNTDLAVRDRFTPSLVKAIELVAIADAFRIAQTQTHITKGDSLACSRNPNGSPKVERSVVRQNCVDMNNGGTCGLP